MIQPFKRITIIMKEATNQGMKEVTKKNIDPMKQLSDSKFFYPVKLDGTTDNKKHMGVIAKANADRVIGVVGETFDRAEIGTQIVISGIVPMKAAAGIKAGDPVMADTTEGQVAKATKAAATKGFFGVALSGSKTAGDTIDVLLRIGGGIPNA